MIKLIGFIFCIAFIHALQAGEQTGRGCEIAGLQKDVEYLNALCNDCLEVSRDSRDPIDKRLHIQAYWDTKPMLEEKQNRLAALLAQR